LFGTDYVGPLASGRGWSDLCAAVGEGPSELQKFCDQGYSTDPEALRKAALFAAQGNVSADVRNTLTNLANLLVRADGIAIASDSLIVEEDLPTELSNANVYVKHEGLQQMPTAAYERELVKALTDLLQKPLLCLDFDSTIQVGDPDDPTAITEFIDGAVDALRELSKDFDILIFTARTDFGPVWVALQQNKASAYVLDITNVKPVMAHEFVDDKATQFLGEWTPEFIEAVKNFQPYWKATGGAQTLTILKRDSRKPEEDAGYMEFPGAVKDADCKTVYVKGGVSKELGCCNDFGPADEQVRQFKCGTCDELIDKAPSVSTKSRSLPLAKAANIKIDPSHSTPALQEAERELAEIIKKVFRRQRDRAKEKADRLLKVHDEMVHALIVDGFGKAARRISATVGVRKPSEKGPEGGRTEAQSILFMPKDAWTKEDVRAWLKDHDFKTEIQETDSSYRARQADPDDFERIRTIPFKNGKKKIEEFDLAKQDDDAINIADAIFEALQELFGEIPMEAAPPLRHAAFAGIGKGVAELDLTDDDMISALNQGAQDWADERAAELVGMHKLEDGTFVENADAKWAISDTTRDDLRSIVTDAFGKETPMPDLIEQIREAGAFSDSRAEMIARTEVARAQCHANYDVWKDSGVVKKLQWQTSVEPNTCDDCKDANGEVVSLGETFPGVDVEAPPAHPNAVFEGSVFAPYGRLQQMLGAPYHGPAIALELELAENCGQSSPSYSSFTTDVPQRDVKLKEALDERQLLPGDHGWPTRPIGSERIKLTIGPNHPMLTCRGFLFAHELKKGDELLYDMRMESARMPAMEPNLEQVPLIQDAFESLRGRFGYSFVAAPRSYFHGDETFVYGEVQAVRPARSLLSELDSSELEHLCKCPLSGAYPDGAHVASCGTCQLGFQAFFATARSSVGRFKHLSTLAERSSAPKFFHASPVGNAGSGVSGCQDDLALLCCEPGPPFFKAARILQTQVGRFHGWAFDASTTSHIYNIGGIVVKNCDCAVIAVSFNKALGKGWVTIRGAHVFINDAGVIEQGPASMIGQKAPEAG
jgi:SPP1 gp7 family putative phage head morphogenesis protein